MPRDGGTGLTDGAVPLRHGIVVDVKRMNQIHEIDLDNRTCTVGDRDQHAQAQRGARPARPDLSGQPGVVPVLARRRPHRHQRLVADRVALRAQPRPRAQLRPRAADRRRDARRRRHRPQDLQELERLPAQAPVHGPPGHARHRDPGDAQAVPEAGGRAVAVLRLRRLRQRLPLHRRAGPGRRGDVRRGGAVRRVEGRLPAARRRGLHPPAGRREGARVRRAVRLGGRGPRRRQAADADRPRPRRPLPRRRDLRGRLGGPPRPLRHAAARPHQGRAGRADELALRGRLDQLHEPARGDPRVARHRRRAAPHDRRVRRLGHVRLHQHVDRRRLPHRDRRRDLGAAARRRGVGAVGAGQARHRRRRPAVRRLDQRLPRLVPRGRGRPRARRSSAAATT